ncbi:homoserine kinase [Ferribacterium limneticum]|uniref:homoserine kinase n=1 Tax=Ferribacterium limneticum TaxID=76259 RepID=UPI001CFA8CA6|nr:homoserine kinase [Ferribacterium limneticum]UCV28702.1 homoserine kinase [Ferribacterium limneticum]UCV32619.1 homoserine kinase [Ferribacterium limneticum]
MSVYTKVGRDDLAAWLQPLGLGELIDHAGIAAGMQNSNYFVTTTRGRFVLTLFERIDPSALDFYLALQDSLARRGIPCPQPVADGEGRYWRLLCDKPAALLTCLSGAALETPAASHCHAAGEMLARLHLAAADMPNPLPNPCGAAWRQTVGTALLPLVSAEEHDLLADELVFQDGQDWAGLPRGVIHADLFRDNVLWDSTGRLSGVLDFYFAGEDAWLFDLAVVANDWCFDETTLAALITGYTAQRPLIESEREAWPAMRRAAALRFWLLRLEVRHQPRAGEVVTIKNPDDFRHLLARFRLAPEALPR